MNSWKKALALLMALTLVMVAIQGCKPQDSGKTGENQASGSIKAGWTELE